jgi:hypothetical protein
MIPWPRLAILVVIDGLAGTVAPGDHRRRRGDGRWMGRRC